MSDPSLLLHAQKRIRKMRFPEFLAEYQEQLTHLYYSQQLDVHDISLNNWIQFAYSCTQFE